MEAQERIDEIIESFRNVLDGEITVQDVFKLLQCLITNAQALYNISKAGSLKKQWVKDAWDYIDSKYKFVNKIPVWWVRLPLKYFGRPLLDFLIDGLVDRMKSWKILPN